MSSVLSFQSAVSEMTQDSVAGCGGNNMNQKNLQGGNLFIGRTLETFHSMFQSQMEANEEDDDYGFCSSMDDDATSSNTLSTKMSFHSCDSHHSSLFEEECNNELSCSASRSRDLDSVASTVIYELEDNKAPLTCRSFGEEATGSYLTAMTCIEGLRLVQDERGEDAEFKVKLTIDGVDYIAWKRFSEFQALGDACMEYGAVADSSLMSGTAKCWRKVVAHRPWFTRNLDIQYLLEELNLLEEFLRNALFETPKIGLLISFMR